MNTGKAQNKFISAEQDNFPYSRPRFLRVSFLYFLVGRVSSAGASTKDRRKEKDVIKTRVEGKG